MKNIIIQHWNGPRKDWDLAAEKSMRMYADKCNAEYKFLTKDPYPGYPNFFQKIYIIDEIWDEYDDVLMLDIDMVATKNFDNIFNYEGIGRLHYKGMASLNGSRTGSENPKIYIKGAPIFFGNCVKLNKEERIALRQDFDPAFFLQHKTNAKYSLVDEAVLSYLIHTTGALKNKKTLELPHDRFCDLPEEAHSQASLLHFCGGRKDNIIAYVKKTYGEIF